MTLLKEQDFVKQFNELRNKIKNSVYAFSDESGQAKRERIKRAENDKIFFAETYFPHYCTDPFSKSHEEIFDLCDILRNVVILAGTRDLAKSTLASLIDVIHKAVYKKRHCIPIISKSSKHAMYEFIMPIMAEFEYNERLIHDFGNQVTDVWSIENLITKSGCRIVPKGLRTPIKSLHHGPHRVDHIIFEDIEDRRSPMSPQLIKKTITWIKTDVLKSVNSKFWSAIYLCNYSSRRSVAHQFLTAEDYKHWKRKIFKALTYDKKGQPHSIWASHLPLRMLLKEKNDDPVTFGTERQQQPADEDATFKEEWWTYFNKNEVLSRKLPIISWVDPSAKKGQESCYKAIIFIAIDKELAEYYILHAWIRKTSKWAMIRTHFQLMELYKSTHNIVESNSFQDTLREDYEIMEQELGKTYNVKFRESKTNKIEDINSLETTIQRGKMKFLRNHSDQNLLKEMFLYFPEGFIDGPDATARAKMYADRFIVKFKKRKIKARIFGAKS